MTETNTQYKIEDVPLSKKRRVRNPRVRRTKYPFDDLEVGQSFFIPATEANPNPAKSLASTVSSASKRYAIESGTRAAKRRNKETGEVEAVQIKAYKYQRRFSVQSVYGEDDVLLGARVGRVAVDESDDGATGLTTNSTVDQFGDESTDPSMNSTVIEPAYNSTSIDFTADR